MSTKRGMDKENVVHIYNGLLLTHKKNEITSFVATWMDLETIILSERQTYDITCMWNLKKKKDTNELFCGIETDSQALKNLWLPKGTGRASEGGTGGLRTEVYGVTGQQGPEV